MSDDPSGAEQKIQKLMGRLGKGPVVIAVAAGVLMLLIVLLLVFGGSSILKFIYFDF